MGEKVTPEFKTKLVMVPNRDPDDFKSWDGREFKLEKPLVYIDSEGRIFEVPAGFVFNGATTRPGIKWLPEWLKDIIQYVVEMFVKPMGKHAEATALHDYIYTDPNVPVKRKRGDKIFYEALKVSGCSSFWSHVFYRTVRIVAGPKWTERTYIF